MKFQPVIKWSGSKRSVSEEIIKYFPKEIDTYYEPFCGGCSMMFQLINSNIKVNKVVCSDINKDLIDFFNKLKQNPYIIYEEYKNRWNNLVSKSTIQEKKEYYNSIRSNYNKNKNVFDFIFLSRTSANGLIRYNSKGEFNAPFHLTRNGINPDNFLNILLMWNNKINEYNVEFINMSYENIDPKQKDYIFLDPPYANTRGMYNGVIDFENFWKKLREFKCGYSLTFDGKTGEKDNTYNVPSDLYDKHIYLNEKISGFGKLHNKNNYVMESLYIKNNC